MDAMMGGSWRKLAEELTSTLLELVQSYIPVKTRRINTRGVVSLFWYHARRAKSWMEYVWRWGEGGFNKPLSTARFSRTSRGESSAVVVAAAVAAVGALRCTHDADSSVGHVTMLSSLGDGDPVDDWVGNSVGNSSYRYLS